MLGPMSGIIMNHDDSDLAGCVNEGEAYQAGSLVTTLCGLYEQMTPSLE